MELPNELDQTVYPLSSNMRVVGLPRKSKNGYRFYVVDSLQMEKRHGEAPRGYARVLKTSKDGKVTAQLESGGSKISFHTRNKVIWPQVPNGNPEGLRQTKSRRKKS